jgi:hypothetical protein
VGSRAVSVGKWPISCVEFVDGVWVTL